MPAENETNNLIVLINPPVPDNRLWVREGRCQQLDIWGAPFPPLSLALISAQLVKSGFRTIIIDSGPEGKIIKDVLAECYAQGPALVILSTSTPTIETDLNWFAKSLKATLPGVKIAAIGIHASALPRRVLEQYKAVDFVVIGEPEIACMELAMSVLRNASSVTSVKGIAYRNANGEVVVNEPREFIDDIDMLGFPDWEKIDFKNYRLPISNRLFSLISFSRGCPFGCYFCAASAYYGNKMRKRRVDNIIDEIYFNLSFGVKDFLFWTESMTMDRVYLLEFLQALSAEKLNTRIRWVCNSRSDLTDYDIFRRMKKAGCWQIAFGFEFGDEDILRLANKAGGTGLLEKGRLAARLAHKAGIAVDGHFILGYPGENERTIDATINYAYSLPLTFAHFYTATPFPGSRLYSKALEKGWLISDRWELFRQDAAVIKTAWLPPQLIEEKINQAYRKFYRRPGVLLRIAGIPRNPKEFYNLARSALLNPLSK